MVDVDRDLRVDVYERSEEASPVGDVMPPADSHELPRRVLGKIIGHVTSTEAQGGLTSLRSSEAVVQHPVQAAALLVDAHILGGGVKDAVSQVLDRDDRLDALPEEVARVHLRTDLSGIDALDQP